MLLRDASLIDQPLQGTGLLRQFSTWTAMFFWVVACVGSPLYLLPSGLPQIGDLLLVLAALAVIASGVVSMPFHARGFLGVTSLFVAYVFAVSAFWAHQMDDAHFMIVPLFYLFNLLVCVTFLSLHDRLGVRFLNWTLVALLGAVASQVAATVLLSGGSPRDTGTFNNPNQLGYFAILVASLFWSASRASGLWKPLVLVTPAVYFACLYLALVSQSRAAIASLALLLVLSMVGRRRIAALCTIAVGALAIAFNVGVGDYQRFEARVEHRSSGYGEEAEVRGYDRILRYPEYTIFGAGEGGLERFWGSTHELHSSLGTVLFSYGLVGLMLFLGIFWNIVRVSGWASLIYILPVFCYSLTHQGLRQAEFWMLLSLLVAVGPPQTKGVLGRTRDSADDGESVPTRSDDARAEELAAC